MKNNSKEFGSTVLFEFQTIVDLDLALLKYIQNEYKDSKFFNKHVLLADDYILKSLLLTRDNKNPLSVIIDDKYKDSIDSLYEEIIQNKESELFKYATPLAPLIVLNMLTKTDSGIDCVVNCKNVEEEQFIKHIKSDIRTTIEGYNIDLSKYDGIYIKNVEDSIKYKKFNGKSIYFLEYKYNLEPNKKDMMPLFNISIIIANTNNLYLVSPYTDFSVPI